MSRSGDIAIIDEPVVAQLLDLGPEVLDELITLYRQQLDVLLPQVSDSDPAVAGRAAHQLKGSSANLGLARVAFLAGGIERGEAGLLDELPPALAEGLAALQQRSA